ncbi:hypothetical protein [Kineococcus glutinatus]|uniref:hypothetical protein n=1 Tax=Kineococcus glutinatus TaxID=1070872 RepID=UPI0031EAC698
MVAKATTPEKGLLMFGGLGPILIDLARGITATAITDGLNTDHPLAVLIAALIMLCAAGEAIAAGRQHPPCPPGPRARTVIVIVVQKAHSFIAVQMANFALYVRFGSGRIGAA